MKFAVRIFVTKINLDNHLFRFSAVFINFIILISCLSMPQGYRKLSQDEKNSVKDFLASKLNHCKTKQDVSFLGVLELQKENISGQMLSGKMLSGPQHLGNLQVEGSWSGRSDSFALQAQSPIGQAILDLEIDKDQAKTTWLANPFLFKSKTDKSDLQTDSFAEAENAVAFITSLKPSEIKGFICGLLLTNLVNETIIVQDFVLQDNKKFETNDKNLRADPYIIMEGKILLARGSFNALSKFFFKTKNPQWPITNTKESTVIDKIFYTQEFTIETKITSKIPFTNAINLSWRGMAHPDKNEKSNRNNKEDLSIIGNSGESVNIESNDIYPQTLRWSFGDTIGTLTLTEFE